MESSRQLTVIAVVLLLASFYFGQATIATSSLTNHEVTTLLEPILTNLGFQELARAVPTLSGTAFTTWNGPSTLFAPSEASIRSYSAATVTHLLREHIVPGLFSHDCLKKLSFGTKIKSMNPGRCITVTSDADIRANATKIFISGVEITRPNLFNNGLIVVHGLQGYIAPLSPFSCNVKRMNSHSFPSMPHHYRTTSEVPYYRMRPMLRDAMLRLRSTGFNVLTLAMKVKYSELVNLNNMTVFALDDKSILSGSNAYVSSVRFHIVPNKLLAISDLEKIPAGTALPTLEKGQSLLVTGAGGGAAPMRINYVGIKVPDVIRNPKIVVHSVYQPFPHLRMPAAATSYNESGSCDAVIEGTSRGSCAGDVAPIPARVEMDDLNHGLYDECWSTTSQIKKIVLLFLNL